MVDTLLMILAVLSLALATLGVPLGRVSLLALGLTLWAIAALLRGPGPWRR